MNLFEAIVVANNRAVAGDAAAGLQLDEFTASLPIVALSCIDARLNPLLPDVLGVPESQFIWLRNAGNIITGTLSSTLRSLGLACAIKGGKEIVIIGHTDCLVCRTTMMQLTDRLRALQIDRSKLPENLNEYFGLCASERQNVVKAVDFVRSSPLIGPGIPVHGLIVDIQTGRLDWIVNGYQAVEKAAGPTSAAMPALGTATGLEFPDFQIGEMKFPEGTIGSHAQEESVSKAPPPPLPVAAKVGVTMAGKVAGSPQLKRGFETGLSTTPARRKT